MDSLLFVGTLVAVAWTIIWTVMNGAHPETEGAEKEGAKRERAEEEGGTLNARGRGKSRISPQNLARNLARNPAGQNRGPV
jgi:hypothetical protein